MFNTIFEFPDLSPLLWIFMADVQPEAPLDLAAPLPYSIVIIALQGQKHPALSDAQPPCSAALLLAAMLLPAVLPQNDVIIHLQQFFYSWWNIDWGITLFYSIKYGKTSVKPGFCVWGRATKTMMNCVITETMTLADTLVKFLPFNTLTYKVLNYHLFRSWKRQSHFMSKLRKMIDLFN